MENPESFEAVNNLDATTLVKENSVRSVAEIIKEGNPEELAKLDEKYSVVKPVENPQVVESITEVENDLTKEKIIERRFELPTQDEARARLDTFRGTVKEFQKEYPEVLGATVYGSMIKGQQARTESDVDAFLYVDVETHTQDKRDKSDPSIYRTKFLEKLGATDKEEESKYYDDLRTQLLSSEIIEKEIADQLAFYEKNATYKEMLNNKYGEASEEEKERLLKEEPDFRTIQFGIAGMFHARVGSGIEKYRKKFLEKIVALPDKNNAEKLWGEVASQIRTMEQRNNPNIQIKTPDTLRDALRTYDPEFYSTMQEEI